MLRSSANNQQSWPARTVTTAGTRTTVGIALIDGTPMFREGMSALAHRTPRLRWIGATDDVGTARLLCRRFRPNVVLLDSALDPRHQLSHTLTADDPSLAVVVLISDVHRETRYVAGALAAGAHGAVLRTAEPSRIVDAIRLAYEQRRYLDPALSMPRDRPTRTPGATKQPLSKREHQVLQLIADGLENQAIAKILFVSVETVRTHVKSILRKLAARDRTHAVAVAFRSGVLVADQIGSTAARG